MVWRPQLAERFIRGLIKKRAIFDSFYLFAKMERARMKQKYNKTIQW